MRPRVGEIERQRRLRIKALRGFDAGGGAAQRAPAVGADDQAHARLTINVLDRHAGGIGRNRNRRTSDTRKLQFHRSCLERSDEMPVLDVVAESVEVDLGGGKQNFRGANEPLGVVDEADFTQQRGVRHAGRPHAERFQRRDRAGKQRRGAVVGLRRRCDQ
jgi:hypothetical protein